MFLKDLSYYHGWQALTPQRQRKLDAQAALSPHPSVAVGWLEQNDDYPMLGFSLSEPLMAKLAFVTCQIPPSQYMGYQKPLVGILRPRIQADKTPGFMEAISKFHGLPENASWLKEGRQVSVTLGAGELAIGSPTKIYHFPSSLYHYIKDGNYTPPSEFLEALDQFIPDKLMEGFSYAYSDAFGKQHKYTFEPTPEMDV